MSRHDGHRQGTLQSRSQLIFVIDRYIEFVMNSIELTLPNRMKGFRELNAHARTQRRRPTILSTPSLFETDLFLELCSPYGHSITLRQINRLVPSKALHESAVSIRH